jgi:hypothetical protein
MGVRCNASPPPKQAFQTLIGEPGHTQPHAARLGRGDSYSGMFGCALLSKRIEGLPTPRK